jgi:hypothetical protein
MGRRKFAPGLTWLFFFLYGPVEDALPVYVAHDLHADAALLGAYWTSFGVGAIASTLLTGMLRTCATRRITLLIVAGWGACLVRFGFAPAAATLVCFAVGGLVYGPFNALTYVFFRSTTTTTNLPSVLAARSAALIVAAPLGTAIGGAIVASLGAGSTRRLRRRDGRAGLARDGPLAPNPGKVRGKLGDQTDQGSRSAVPEQHLA